MTATSPEPIRIVLDTNVVLDWLVFQDSSLQRLHDLSTAGRVIVMTHELAIAELARVLDYPQLGLSADQRADLIARYRSQTAFAEMPSGFDLNAWQLPAKFPSCRDRDDDLFLALAYHGKVAALVTRDRELLRMQKRVRKLGVAILGVPQLAELLSESRPALI